MTQPWTAADIPDQAGRTAVVTGATSGLGLASARSLAAAGARVLLAARNPSKAEGARDEVAAVATGPDPEVIVLDLADLESVRAGAADIAERAPSLDVLMNNAGVMALPLARTAQGFEMQLGTNHLGHFALTGLLLPQLLAAPASRVVTTSSNMHKTGRMRWDDLQGERRYRRWPAYGQSKLANLLFTYELDRRARAEDATLVAAAAHPGYAATHLQAAAPEASGRALVGQVMELGNSLFAQPAEAGALPQLYAATMPDVRGGDYFGPDGLAEMRGAPVRVTSTRRARDREAAARLWEVSERLTGVSYDWGASPPG
jgi:NAD(P)-dependent dehydrogenase (short-subunit alcohol dehydrogenase family)